MPRRRSTPVNRRDQVWASAIIGFFLLISGGTCLVDTLFPVPPPKLLGEEKAEDARLRRRVRWRDGSLARLVEHDLQLKSRVRRILSQDYTFSLFYWLGETKNMVLVGKDRWLFFKSRVYPLADSEERAAFMAAKLSAVSRRFDDRGAKLVVVPVPRKGVVHRQFLPSRVDPRSELDSLVVDLMTARGVACADLVSRFQAQAAETLYYKYGAHWTQRGEMIAAEEVCRAAGILAAPENLDTEIREAARVPGDLDILRFMGLELTNTKTLKMPRFRRFFTGPTARAFDVFEIGGDRFAEDRLPEPGRVCMLGTSFTALRKFPRFIAHYGQLPLYNGARPGGNLGRLLLHLLRESRGLENVEIVLLEFPIFNILRPGPTKLDGEIFAQLQPLRYTAIAGPDRFAVAEDLRLGTSVTPRKRRVASLERLAFVHSADGIVSVRFVGEVQGGGMDVAVSSGSGQIISAWEPDVRELILPVVGSRSSATADIFVSASPGAKGTVRCRLDTVELVTDLDQSSFVVGTLSGITKAGDHWTQEIEFGHSLPERSFAAVEIRLSHDGRPLGPISVQAHSTGNQPAQASMTVNAVGRNTVVILNIGPLAGHELSKVVLTGSGQAPANLIQSALIFEKSILPDSPRSLRAGS